MSNFDEKMDILSDKLSAFGKKVENKAKEHITEEDQKKIKEKTDSFMKKADKTMDSLNAAISAGVESFKENQGK